MLKTLLAEVKQYKKASILTPAFMVGEVVMEILIPMLMAYLIDSGVEKGDGARICITGGAMAVMAMLSLACGVLSGKYGARASSGFGAQSAPVHVPQYPDIFFSNIDKYSTAGLVTRMTTDVTNVQNAYQMILRMCTRAPVMLLCAMAAAFSISARLSLIFVAAIAFLGVALFFITKNSHPVFRQVFRKYDDLNASVQENVSAIRVVKAYVREDHETQKFHTANDNVYRLFVKAETVLALNSPVMQFTMYMCILAISWLGAHMIAAQSHHGSAHEPVYLRYEHPDEPDDALHDFRDGDNGPRLGGPHRRGAGGKGGPHLPPAARTQVEDGRVDFDHVSFSYKKKAASPYWMTLICTSARARPSASSAARAVRNPAWCSSSPACTTSRKARCAWAAWMCADTTWKPCATRWPWCCRKNVLFSGTIRENLRWGDKNATDEEMGAPAAWHRRTSSSARCRTAMTPYIEQGGTNVSGGQKQRLCIARALLKKPKILILDDSTSAVDTRTDTLIRRAFAEEIPDTTKFIIAQRISSVQDADRILVLDGGRVAAFGTHDELLCEQRNLPGCL